MATEFYIPKLGQTVEEVTIIQWQVEDGVKVRRGDELLEVETDKAVFPVEANGKGFLHKGPFKAGDVVPILTVVGIIGAEADVFEAATGETEKEPEAIEQEEMVETIAVAAPTTVVSGERLFASPRAKKLAAESNVDLSKVTATGAGGLRIVEKDVTAFLTNLPKITPVAKKLAEQKGVDWTTLSGTGSQGKISKEDVLSALAAPVAPVVVEKDAVMQMVTGVESVRVPLPLADVAVTERIPVTGVRKVIAERMATSVHTTARVTLMMEVDATDFVTARNEMKAAYSKSWGFAPGYNDLLAKIVAAALKKYPYMNARITPDAIEYLADINVALAVDTDRGLMVPVIPCADEKSLQEFGSEFREKVERARAGRALPDDLSGGTFTITNLGMYDVEAFTPVINLPEAAILGVGKIISKPVVKNGEIVVREMLSLSLVFDHRVVDGAPAAKFMQYIKQVIENPFMLLA